MGASLYRGQEEVLTERGRDGHGPRAVTAVCASPARQAQTAHLQLQQSRTREQPEDRLIRLEPGQGFESKLVSNLGRMILINCRPTSVR